MLTFNKNDEFYVIYDRHQLIFFKDFQNTGNGIETTTDARDAWDEYDKNILDLMLVEHKNEFSSAGYFRVEKMNFSRREIFSFEISY